MTAGVYTYHPERGQRICFRGYVQYYEANRRIRISAPLVRTIKAEALRDARIMLKMATARGITSLKNYP